jgi:hypothetical protein
MSRQIINTGTSPNKGDGDPLRTSFSKINNNFEQLFRGPLIYTTEERNQITAVPGSIIYNSTMDKFQGYVQNDGSGNPGWINLH